MPEVQDIATATKSLKGTETEKNLLKAFAGESQARNRYTYFAKVAKKEGFEQISAIFLETAEHEREHAKQFFKLLEGGAVEITAMYPAGVLATTADHLREAAAGEHEEWAELYPAFADVAEAEGFKAVAAKFRQVAKAESWHETRYRALLEKVEAETVFERAEPAKWMCRKCGYVHEGPKPPKVCPACTHPQAYYEIYAQNY
jgi:rubrerythrin